MLKTNTSYQTHVEVIISKNVLHKKILNSSSITFRIWLFYQRKNHKNKLNRKKHRFAIFEFRMSLLFLLLLQLNMEFPVVIDPIFKKSQQMIILFSFQTLEITFYPEPQIRNQTYNIQIIQFLRIYNYKVNFRYSSSMIYAIDKIALIRALLLLGM